MGDWPAAQFCHPFLAHNCGHSTVVVNLTRVIANLPLGVMAESATFVNQNNLFIITI